MALTLYVAPAWRTHISEVWDQHPGIVPVVKGNGYGFGRDRLFKICAARDVDIIGVGTVHEVAGVPARAMVLTPLSGAEVALVDDTPDDTIFTVGSARDARALAGRRPAVIKLASEMGRYGVLSHERSEVEHLVGANLHGYSIHLPLDGGQVMAADLPDASLLYVSHLESTPRISGLRVRQRIGTRLWLGDKSNLRLRADVVHVRVVHAGEVAGYRRRTIGGDGAIVMVSAGTAHGVQLLDDGSSPFHFGRRRVRVLEPPHMHTTMLWFPAHESCPRPGDEVDVQQPLTRVLPDRVVW